jgi:hypothetical protein
MKKGKITLEETIKKIKKLNKSLSEQNFFGDDDFGGEELSNDDESFDHRSDDDAEQIFMSAMDKIREIRGSDYSEDVYHKWVESYFFKRNGPDEDMGPM